MAMHLKNTPYLTKRQLFLPAGYWRSIQFIEQTAMHANLKKFLGFSVGFSPFPESFSPKAEKLALKTCSPAASK
jgi:hypothetical protein